MIKEMENIIYRVAETFFYLKLDEYFGSISVITDEDEVSEVNLYDVDIEGSDYYIFILKNNKF